MKHFFRPYSSVGLALLLGTGAWAAIAPAAAQARTVDSPLAASGQPVQCSSSQGYLGVDLADVDPQKAQALKLKEVRGALITLIDHDAPACKSGLRVNDVVVQLNGQRIEGAMQLRRMLREIPAGRKVTLAVSRDGRLRTLVVELADRSVVEHDAWNRIGSDGDPGEPSPGTTAGGGGARHSGGFHVPFFGGSLKVGVLVEPLTAQMAGFLGIPGGLIVRQVTPQSEAAVAGLQPFDVILKVGPSAVLRLADWEHALRANQGKPVEVTILRDRKQQTLTLQVDSKRRGELQIDEIFPARGEIARAEMAQLSDSGLEANWRLDHAR
jgi:C-terminal processing protease CtpA/Prc